MKKLTIGTVLAVIGLLVSILVTVSNVSFDYGQMKADVKNVKDTQKALVQDVNTVKIDVAAIKTVVVTKAAKVNTPKVTVPAKKDEVIKKDKENVIVQNNSNNTKE